MQNIWIVYGGTHEGMVFFTTKNAARDEIYRRIGFCIALETDGPTPVAVNVSYNRGDGVDTRTATVNDVIIRMVKVQLP